MLFIVSDCPPFNSVFLMTKLTRNYRPLCSTFDKVHYAQTLNYVSFIHDRPCHQELIVPVKLEDGIAPRMPIYWNAFHE